MRGVWIDVSLSLALAQAIELPIFSNNADGQIFVVQLSFVGESPSKSFDAMVDELIQSAILEGVQVLLQIRASALGTSADSHSLAVIEVGAWARLIDMWSLILERANLIPEILNKKIATHVITSDKQTDTVRATIVTLSADLHLQAQQIDQATDWIVAAIRVLMIDALLAHIAAENKDCSRNIRRFSNEI